MHRRLQAPLFSWSEVTSRLCCSTRSREQGLLCRGQPPGSAGTRSFSRAGKGCFAWRGGWPAGRRNTASRGPSGDHWRIHPATLGASGGMRWAALARPAARSTARDAWRRAVPRVAGVFNLRPERCTRATARKTARNACRRAAPRGAGAFAFRPVRHTCVPDRHERRRQSCALH